MAAVCLCSWTSCCSRTARTSPTPSAPTIRIFNPVSSFQFTWEKVGQATTCPSIQSHRSVCSFQDFQSRDLIWPTLLALFLVIMVLATLGTLSYHFRRRILRTARAVRDRVKATGSTPSNALRSIFKKRPVDTGQPVQQATEMTIQVAKDPANNPEVESSPNE